jgi:hypothetical protein
VSGTGDVLRIGEIDLVTKDTLARLSQRHEFPCVSILLPTHTAGPPTRQDPIRFSNLVRAADQSLVTEHGLTARQAVDLLAPAWALADDRDFWRHQSDGLALYAAPHFTQTLRVPLPLEEEVTIGPSFRTRPLLGLVAGDGNFSVLALSVNMVRLFAATRFTIAELPLGPVPASMADALAHEDPEAQLQVRAGGQGGMFHGHGVGDEVDKQALERFFRAVDRGLQARLRSSTAPLVLAAVRYYLPIFRSVTGHPAVATRAAEGSPEGRSPRDLHAAAWEIVAPMFATACHEAEERMRAALAAGRAATGPEDVVAAALTGRVDELFLPDDEPVWGRAENEAAVVHAQRQQGDIDVLDRAATETLAAGGAVHVHTRNDTTADKGPVAVLRW